MKAHGKSVFSRTKKASKKNPLIVTIVSGVAVAGLFGLATLIFNFGDWPVISKSAALGLFLGFLAAPEFEPNHFKFPVLWQTACGGSSGLMLAAMFNPNYMVPSVFVGLILGATAKLWIMHVPGP